MKPSTYDRVAGSAAALAGLIGLGYAIAFVLLGNALLSAVCLALGGLLSLVALIALFARLADIDQNAALLGLVLGAAGALGAAVHGAYDLANAIHPPATVLADLPSAVDPRGFLTFGVAGIALLLAGGLMRRDAGFPRGLAALSLALAALLVVIYLGRLIVLSPTSPLVLGPAALTGFLVNPLWYFWLGAVLRRPETQGEASESRGVGRFA